MGSFTFLADSSAVLVTEEHDLAVNLETSQILLAIMGADILL